MTKLILIRHGETEWNLLGKIQGCTDIELTPNGIQQANEVAQQIKGNFDIIYSSPLHRALITAQKIAGDKEVHLIEGMKEIPFGTWEGHTFEELNGDINYKKFLSGEDGCPFDSTGMSIASWSKKNAQLLLDLCKQNENKTIVCVSHGAWIKTSILGLLEMEPTMYHKFQLGNTGITTFIFRHGHPVLTSFNSTQHLLTENKSKTGHHHHHH
uniref:Phosphoglycerate mutase family protein n=1 Tax=Entamoeba histolytica TaxID=5759 RepID=UPI0010706A07|nr:Chain A, Phosphoglycerate mutase family protein, putative [Entamoeba histolytica HM-1:IMSS-A]5ZKK_B Chain B, Phosphoglycerate mutase family protein, putative [Entamoeba histolytica HM-1:IMSS-A]6M1X_A Chain A, Phosphoglycerate mutase family protein [Entamoeba histolytica]6M1X_B Chain B, Phosphoglycerate mutase family protein [Entamoeba histolytica]6M1X_C Chain C, Phosphoglycerate mutase family protein [Entamoeba histolytica]6M1X_D Chain D, Phosphoglycerate mutase family protein [Entamoeba hi